MTSTRKACYTTCIQVLGDQQGYTFKISFFIYERRVEFDCIIMFWEMKAIQIVSKYSGINKDICPRNLFSSVFNMKNIFDVLLIKFGKKILCWSSDLIDWIKKLLIWKCSHFIIDITLKMDSIQSGIKCRKWINCILVKEKGLIIFFY